MTETPCDIGKRGVVIGGCMMNELLSVCPCSAVMVLCPCMVWDVYECNVVMVMHAIE